MAGKKSAKKSPKPAQQTSQKREKQSRPAAGAPPQPANGRRHPGLEEAWKSSEPGPRPLVAFLAAGALLLLTALVAGFTWGAHQLGVPVFLALPVLVVLLLGGFLLLQRSVKD